MRETVTNSDFMGIVEEEVDRRIESISREIDEQALKVQTVHYHPDRSVDLAVLETDFEEYPFPDESSRKGTSKKRSAAIPIGAHVDEWISDQFVLRKVLVMGYPIVPWAKSQVLVTTEAEVNALVSNFRGPHPYYIVSSTARGGFSGAPVISDDGLVIGVVVEELYRKQKLEDKLEETGFNAAITIEPLVRILINRGIRPACIDADIWTRFSKG